MMFPIIKVGTTVCWIIIVIQLMFNVSLIIGTVQSFQLLNSKKQICQLKRTTTTTTTTMYYHQSRTVHCDNNRMMNHYCHYNPKQDHHHHQQQQQKHHRLVHPSLLVLKSSSSNNNNNNNDDDRDNNTDQSSDNGSSSSSSSGGGMTFLKRIATKIGTIGQGNNKQEEANTATATATLVTAATSTVVDEERQQQQQEEATTITTTTAPPTRPVSELTPFELATKLRADAARSRLEAERMDAELTLRKINKLEKEIKKSIIMSKKSSINDDNDNNTTTRTITTKSSTEAIEQMQREMESLRAKLAGEEPKPILLSKSQSTTKTSSSSSTSSSSDGTTTIELSSSSDESLAKSTKSLRTNNKIQQMTVQPIIIPGRGFNESRLSTLVAPFNQERFDENSNFVKQLPIFLQKAMLLAINGSIGSTTTTSSDDDQFNVTELAIRVDMMDRLDFSFSTEPAPIFTPEQIETKRLELLDNERAWFKTITLDPLIDEERKSGKLKDNETDYAICVLEYDYYSNVHFTDFDGVDLLGTSDFQNQFQAIANEGRKDAIIEQWFPKCTRDETRNKGIGSTIPSMAQVQMLISDILPKASFSTTSKPEKIIGGYIIRGKLTSSSTTRSVDGSNTATKTRAGDEFITKINDLLKQRNMDDKMNVLYTPDFTVFTRDPTEFDVDTLSDVEPVLYITAPNIVREAKPVQLSIVSGIGIASTWYLSLYPFLLNPIVASRVDEQIQIADANMTPDLSFLTDLSFPLFTTFVTIQLIHELGHLLVAAINNIKTSAPTFVPSIITGITSSVTTFRTLPKNLAAMFDYSISGPLAGMIASIITIAIGTQMTLYAPDMSLFPSLPLEILRQSSLGGGIIDSILGNGALNVPEAALGTPAVAGMTVPLHPVAIAGYISLVVNALSLIPVGTTDGGRVALALFGRGTKLIIGQFSMIALLALGVLGSDLFLFYFAFVIAFQTGNEVPAQNEVDPIDFPRAALATIAYVIAILALVPF